MTLTVRPSAYENPDDPRVRQEKLLKRLERSDYWVRSICTHCGDSWKHQVYAPFNPLDALSGARSRPDPEPTPQAVAPQSTEAAPPSPTTD